ncbi:MAG: DUF309 domain-containing protein [Verrucomicrobiota bacterium]|jgi:predicted metal-dependent hydrolase
MSRKAERIAGMMAGMKGEAPNDKGVDRHYAGYFECFNRGLFYEAHDVLEQLWLRQRGGPNGLFYKGLIQLAGAFVHLQKDRRGPAAALLKLARRNLQGYPAAHEGLEVREVLVLIEGWLGKLEEGVNPLEEEGRPKEIRIKMKNCGNPLAAEGGVVEGAGSKGIMDARVEALNGPMVDEPGQGAEKLPGQDHADEGDSG